MLYDFLRLARRCLRRPSLGAGSGDLSRRRRTLSGEALRCMV